MRRPRGQDQSRTRGPPGHPSQTAKPDNWALRKHPISRPLTVRLKVASTVWGVWTCQPFDLFPSQSTCHTFRDAPFFEHVWVNAAKHRRQVVAVQTRANQIVERLIRRAVIIRLVVKALKEQSPHKCRPGQRGRTHQRGYDRREGLGIGLQQIVQWFRGVPVLCVDRIPPGP